MATAAIAGSTVTAYLRVDRHLNTLLPNGLWMESARVEVGGCPWRIWYYPNGIDVTCACHLSIFLVLDGRVAAPVKARARFSLVDDQAMEPVPGHYSRCTELTACSAVGGGCGFDDFIRWEDLEESAHLVGDDDSSITVRCDITVERAPQLSHLHRRLPVADVTFQVGGETFHAHRCVLASRSPAFQAEVRRVSAAGSIAGDSIVRIENMLPEVFEAFLHFIYTDTLPAMSGPEVPEHLVALADGYELPGLKMICEQELSDSIDEDNIGKMLRLAVQQRCSILMEACVGFLEDPPVLQAAMASDGTLLELVATSCPMLVKELFAYDDDPMQEELLMCL